MEMRIDPKAEWAQEFTDAWRILRDWFYDPAMHGLDWNEIRTKYGQLVPHVAHRADLDYILGEVAGELHAGHAYVGSPSDLNQDRVDNGLLGANIVAADGYFRIDHIYPGENWHEGFRSPLTEPGVKVKEGDYILAVDGATTKGVDNFYRLLENKADRVVTLLVNSRPDTTGAREEKVRPVKKETNLRYLDWVASRRAYVEKVSGGRIGYIHLPNTGAEGNRELVKGFYPQVDKDALIIDDRYNGGGFIPDRMIEMLDRSVLNYWVRRGSPPSATPAFAHVGPKVMLINGYSASGGDALPYYFRKRKLGTIIGTRTWGGLIGISGNPSLMDGGSVSAPTFRFLDTEGMWAVEGNRELFRGMLAYAHKDALIIDDRYNGGGFIPDRMIELLAREPLNYWKSRGVQPNATPLLSHRGPQAMLINGLSSSGGDALPYYFRKLKLGTLIGTRTWGGLIGISGNPPLADNGTILAATFRFLDTDGEWAVENEGVAPDIEVIDRPELIAAGRDPSIERAVQLLLAELEQHPVEPVTAPPPPTQFPPATD
jgi:C-terminal processing protease CtpA/Prc